MSTRKLIFPLQLVHESKRVERRKLKDGAELTIRYYGTLTYSTEGYRREVDAFSIRLDGGGTVYEIQLGFNRDWIIAIAVKELYGLYDNLLEWKYIDVECFESLPPVYRGNEYKDDIVKLELRGERYTLVLEILYLVNSVILVPILLKCSICDSTVGYYIRCLRV